MRRGVVLLFAVALLVSAPSGMGWAGSFEGRAGVKTLNCSTPLTLWAGANRTGGSVQISARGIWVNLSSVSFDNKTSSFKVGACAVDLAPQANGSGNPYPECLYPGCVENTMLPGWDNVISSVYLH